MNLIHAAFKSVNFGRIPDIVVLVCLLAFLSNIAYGQSVGDPTNFTASASETASNFRIEKIPVAGGAEIVTIIARKSNFKGSTPNASSEIPLVSVLRDTLGDGRPENDRLRYLWMLTYTRPSFWQKTASYVPFLYTRTSNTRVDSDKPPQPIADMNAANSGLWNRILWEAFKRILKDEVGFGAKASAIQGRQNAADQKKAAIAEAQTILSLYESVEGEKLWGDAEVKDIQAKLWLSNKPLGGLFQTENLGRFYGKRLAQERDIRGHNWELLRQYSEAQGLYFEPLTMPDGEARQGLVWVSADDQVENRGRKFDSRFLNFKNPWTDPKLVEWKGYTEERWFDEENRIVAPDTPDARSRTMIPLALYGLDHPKIPIMLVDFRDNGNPKRREMSKRILNDLMSNVLSISRFSSIPYFVGRFVYDYVTSRRGIDVNQESRVRSYAQLKMLLALDETLDEGFRKEIAHRLEHMSLDPLENDLDVDAANARRQYQNLIDYARRPDGLPAKLDRDRREEMVHLAHGGAERTLFTAGHVLTLGLYTHREDATDELVAQLDIKRQLAFHERVVQETAYRSADPEVDSDLASLKRSLQYIAQNGSAARDKTTRSLAKLFAITSDDDTRTLCLAGLYKIDSSSAKKELLAIYSDIKIADQWRNLCAQYLKRALVEGQRISSRDAAVISEITAN